MRQRLHILLLATFTACAGTSSGDRVAPIQRIVAGVRSADYRGDLDGLARGERQLRAHEQDPTFAGAARYWRGFALWRRALNRMNDKDFDRAAAIDELRGASEAFLGVSDAVLFADTRSAAAGCMMTLLYVLGPTHAQAHDLIGRFMALMKEATEAGPDNPRVLFVLGGQQLFTPAQFGGSRDRAVETYRRGLAAARASAPAPPLAPSWGEPELLMSLAFAYASVEPTDRAQAEAYAREALALQPDWHYVRDILLPTIVKRPDRP